MKQMDIMNLKMSQENVSPVQLDIFVKNDIPFFSWPYPFLCFKIIFFNFFKKVLDKGVFMCFNRKHEGGEEPFLIEDINERKKTK